ncbi:MAG: IPT/TIG domain-containing protein [Dehalococcoidia bacterium]
MRLLSRLVTSVVICLVATTLLAVPAQAQDGPDITLSPSSGVPGEEVTVRGYNFTALEWVDIYYYLDTTPRIRVKEFQANSAGSFTVKFTIPESYKGAHTVRAAGEDSGYADASFTVNPGLTVSPEEGPVGTNVTVKGHGFAKDEEDIELRYYVNGNYTTIAENIEADEDGSWERRFLIPLSSRGNHRIDAQGETSTQVKDATFQVAPGISLDKSWGSPGDNITATGSGFGSGERDIKILFADQEVKTDPAIVRADATGYWQASFQVPEMPKGHYNVTAHGESTGQQLVTPVEFVVKPGLVLSPPQGHVGTNLTVTGGGFPSSKNVVIKYEGTEQAATTTNRTGGFTITFSVPESQHGERQVTAEDNAGNNATAVFTMESEPPDTPILTSPDDGARLGFIGKVRPRFGWEQVEDPSGVYYSLQIATGSNVTETGFADPLYSVPRLVGTNYTWEEGLPYGTYYWIVQAVDGAENASNWTTPHSFRAGIMPLWAFIVSIVAIVVVIGTALYFFVLRKRTYYY